MLSLQSQKLFDIINAVDSTKKVETTDYVKLFKEVLEKARIFDYSYAEDSDGNTPLMNIIYGLSTAFTNEAESMYYEMMDLLLEKKDLYVSILVGNEKRGALDLAALLLLNKALDKLLNHESVEFYHRHKLFHYLKGLFYNDNHNHNYDYILKQVIGSESPLIEAIVEQDLGKVKKLLQANKDSNVHDKYGESALVWAVCEQNQEIAEELIAAGANIHIKDKIGHYKILGYAINNDHDKIVKYLLEKLNECSITALFDGGKKVVKMLIEAKVDLNSLKHGMTPLSNAILRNNTEIVQIIVENDANVNLPEEDGTMPLMYAVMMNNLKVVQLLLDAGADINTKDKDGKTVEDIACERNYKEIAEILQKQRISTTLSEPNVTSQEGSKLCR